MSWQKLLNIIDNTHPRPGKKWKHGVKPRGAYATAHPENGWKDKELYAMLYEIQYGLG